jgi:hypothetical protein
MAPDLEFRGQPFALEDTAGAFLARTLGDDSMTRLRMAVAWARFGGVARIDPLVSGLRERGGSAEAIVGIDEGVATKPGLRKLVRVFDRVYVVHDPGGRTFHPKLYLVEGLSRAALLVGSSNATAGGLYFNFEASLEATFQLPDESDSRALASTQAYFDQLMADPAVCIELTEEALERLLDDPRYPIGETERRPRRRDGGRGRGEGGDRESDSPADEFDADEFDAPVFRQSEQPRPPVPPLSPSARQELDEIEAEADVPLDDGAEPPGEAEIADVPPASVVLVWSKKLGHADAQQPVSPHTNPIGNLRLTRSGHDIEHRIWFRQDLFGPAAWVDAHDSHGNEIEEAVVPFEVAVGGVDLGILDLRISYAPHREAGQGNVPTVLHWGARLNALLRATDYSGHIVRIERLDDSSFRLQIAP